MSQAHGVFLTHRTQPGRRDEVHQVWMSHMAPAIESNPDHLAYFYCDDLDDLDVLRVFQLYQSVEAAGRFLEQPAYHRYLDAVEPLLEGPPEVHSVQPVWTKGT